MKREENLRSVLLIAPQPFFASRGTPINVRAMASALCEMGYQVDLLVYPQGEAVALPGLTIHRCWNVPGVCSVPVGPSWRKIVLDFSLCLAVLRLATTKSYLVIHGVEEGGFIAGVLSRICRVPYIYDMDSCILTQLKASGFFSWPLLLRLIGGLERYFIRNADAVLTVCRDLSDKVLAVSGQTPIHEIEDFPPQSSAAVNPSLVAKVGAEFGLVITKNLVYTGNFEKYQGLDLLLKAFAMLVAAPSKEAQYRLVLVGGSAKDREYYSKIADQLGISQNTIFTGQRPEEEMGAFMQLASALASPRILGTNTPLKLYAYMASGKPIVATKILSHTQVLDDQSAILADTNPEDYARGLALALSGRAEIAEMAARAKALVESRYSHAEFKRRLAALYDSIAPLPGRPPHSLAKVTSAGDSLDERSSSANGG